MTKQQENRAFAKMLKEFPKVFGRVSFRERLMLRTAFTYVVEEVIADFLEGKDLVIKELGERCGQLLKDKGELTDQIADIKANCDLAIEGRDVKIKELEQELTVEKDQHQEEVNLHLHSEEYIKELEKENAELKSEKGCETCTKFDEVQLTKAKELLKQWVELFKPKGSNIPPTPIQIDTEQFIKEIEK